jgi:hypothetical protein
MYEHCPAGEETTALFKAHFLTRLPVEIRVHLETVEDIPLKQLATRADQLWLTLAARQATAAALQADQLGEECEAMVAALKAKFFPMNKQKKVAGPADGQAAAANPAAQDGGQKKLVSMQLCCRHAKYGSKAYRCADKAACQWPEN